MEINRDTRIIDLTIGQFEDWMKDMGFSSSPSLPEKKYVYGIAGIMALFNVSKSTAVRLKNGKIKDAVSQSGRTIITDTDKALELFNS